jgi:anti-anti-sigma regulatory factor
LHSWRFRLESGCCALCCSREQEKTRHNAALSGGEPAAQTNRGISVAITTAETASARAELTTRTEDGKIIVEPRGDWVVQTIGPFDASLRRIEESYEPGDIIIDLSFLGRIDTSGAYLLGRTLRRCGDPDGDWHYIGEHGPARRLMAEMRRRLAVCPPAKGRGGRLIAVMARIGRGVEDAWSETVDTFAFLRPHGDDLRQRRADTGAPSPDRDCAFDGDHRGQRAADHRGAVLFHRRRGGVHGRQSSGDLRRCGLHRGAGRASPCCANSAC